jgi:hypothetical protein
MPIFSVTTRAYGRSVRCLKDFLRLYRQISFFIVLALILSTCEKPERDNPWDAKSKLSPGSWAPQNFKSERADLTSVKLSWTYGDHHIEGFMIDRKKGDGEWHVAYANIPDELRAWIDDDIVPEKGLSYTYRLYAFAGENKSLAETLSVDATIPSPSNVQVHKQSDVSYKISWEHNSIGGEGFKIDRRRMDEDWQIGLGDIKGGEREFVDTNVFKTKSAVTIEYRVYAWYGVHESAKTPVSTMASITPSSEFTVSVLSPTSISLAWEYSQPGHDGYKIDRKINEADWQESYAVLGKDKYNYTDQGLDLSRNVYRYRHYAFAGEYNSEKNELYISLPVLSTTQVTGITSNPALGGGRHNRWWRLDRYCPRSCMEHSSEPDS